VDGFTDHVSTTKQFYTDPVLIRYGPKPEWRIVDSEKVMIKKILLLRTNDPKKIAEMCHHYDTPWREKAAAREQQELRGTHVEGNGN